MIKVSDNALPWSMGDTQIHPLGYVSGTVQVREGEDVLEAIGHKVKRLKPLATHLFGCLTQKVSVQEAQLDLFHYPDSEYFRFSGQVYRRLDPDAN